MPCTAGAGRLRPHSGHPDPGDGIGPEIVDATLAALDALGAPFEWDRQIAGLEGVKVAATRCRRPRWTASAARAWR
jgi:isocitrate/isopropylmalate dehydrogenase